MADSESNAALAIDVRCILAVEEPEDHARTRSDKYSTVAQLPQTKLATEDHQIDG